MNPKDLLPYCKTEAQKRNVRAYIQAGSIRGAAKLLGLCDKTLSVSIKRIEASVETSDDALAGAVVPPGMGLERCTITTFSGGKTIRHDKSLVDKEAIYESALLAIESACKGIKARPKTVAPKRTNKRLCSVIPLADLHVGMYAFAEQGGADWNIEIAKATVYKAIANLIARSPDSEIGVFMDLGDLAHTDGMKSVTPKHGHILESAGLFVEVQRAVLEICVWAVDEMLKKYKIVKVIMTPGNHNPASSGWLRTALPVIYRNEKRVQVDESPHEYFGFDFGSSFIGGHHGHNKKISALPSVFEADPMFYASYGKAKRVYLSTAHLHEEEVITSGKARVERHTTLCPRDSYSSGGGYAEDRRLCLIVYDLDDGEVERFWVRPS